VFAGAAQSKCCLNKTKVMKFQMMFAKLLKIFGKLINTTQGLNFTLPFFSQKGAQIKDEYYHVQTVQLEMRLGL